jgi:hypothetical protein
MTNRFLDLTKGDVELSEWIAGWYRLYVFRVCINQEIADLWNAIRRLCKTRLNNGNWRICS